MLAVRQTVAADALGIEPCRVTNSPASRVIHTSTLNYRSTKRAIRPPVRFAASQRRASLPRHDSSSRQIRSTTAQSGTTMVPTDMHTHAAVDSTDRRRGRTKSSRRGSLRAVNPRHRLDDRRPFAAFLHGANIPLRRDASRPADRGVAREARSTVTGEQTRRLSPLPPLTSASSTPLD